MNKRTVTVFLTCLLMWGGTSLLCAQSGRTGRQANEADTLERKESLREDTLRTVTVRPGQ